MTAYTWSAPVRRSVRIGGDRSGEFLEFCLHRTVVHPWDRRVLSVAVLDCLGTGPAVSVETSRRITDAAVEVRSSLNPQPPVPALADQIAFELMVPADEGFAWALAAAERDHEWGGWAGRAIGLAQNFDALDRFEVEMSVARLADDLLAIVRNASASIVIDAGTAALLGPAASDEVD